MICNRVSTLRAVRGDDDIYAVFDLYDYGAHQTAQRSLSCNSAHQVLWGSCVEWSDIVTIVDNLNVDEEKNCL